MKIICDNGTEFINKDIQELIKEYGVKLETTAISHPSANPVERSNRTIKPMLAAFIKQQQNTWDENISEIQFAYDTSKYSEMGVSPAFMNYGRIPEPAGRKREDTFNENIETNTQGDCVERMKRLPELWHLVERNIFKAKARQGKYQTNKLHRQLKINDTVYYPNRKLSNKSNKYSAKLGTRYLGLAIISKFLGPMTVELKDLTDKFLGKHFVGDLKIPRRSLRHQPKETDGNSVEQLTMTDTNKTIEAVKLMQEVSSRPSYIKSDHILSKNNLVIPITTLRTIHSKKKYIAKSRN